MADEGQVDCQCWMDGGGRGKAGELSVGRGAGEGEHLLGELVGELIEEGEEIGKERRRQSSGVLQGKEGTASKMAKRKTSKNKGAIS